MIEMAVGDDDEVDLAIADEVEIRHCLAARQFWMQASVYDEGVFTCFD